MKPNSDVVVLLHGLARTSRSMSRLEQALAHQGFIVENIHYPSRRFAIEELAQIVFPKVLEKYSDAQRINFVTHSMGGILLRQYLHHHSIENLHRVVMLGPPNQGSEVVDKLAKWPGFYAINGKAGMQLGTDSDSLPKQLGPVKFDLGIIAGTRSINLILSMLIGGVNDGKVSLDSSKVEGMSHHIAMPVTHAFMMKNPNVINQVIHYLHKGSFNEAAI